MFSSLCQSVGVYTVDILRDTLRLSADTKQFFCVGDAAEFDFIYFSDISPRDIFH